MKLLLDECTPKRLRLDFSGHTVHTVEEAGLTLTIKAPEPQAPSMVAALEKFLVAETKKK